MPPVRRVLFAVNAKASSRKIHRVTQPTMHLPRSQQRLRCGWRVSKSTSLVFSCARLRWGTVCLKCFPPNAGANTEGPKQTGDDHIEQTSDDDIRKPASLVGGNGMSVHDDCGAGIAPNVK